jgi:hypothetical protein
MLVWCLYCVSVGVKRDRRAVKVLVSKLKESEALEYDAAVQAIESRAVAVPREVAEIRKFSTAPAPGSRYRYFEREEVVFRVEEDGASRCRIVPQDKYSG